MAEFWSALSFSSLPLLVALGLAALLPPLGATLYLRNEVLLAIALPPAGALAIAAAVLFGVPEDAHGVLYAVTAVSLFLLILVLPLGVSMKRTSPRRREIILAAVLVLSQTVILILMASSTRVESHLQHLLRGEILAVGIGEGSIVWICFFILAVLSIRYRGLIYAFCLDEENLKISEQAYPWVKFCYRLSGILVLTAGIILAGPILCTTLLILPALMAERQARGLDGYILASMAFGVAGTLFGFAGAIGLDWPPSPSAALGVGAIGGLVILIRRLRV